MDTTATPPPARRVATPEGPQGGPAHAAAAPAARLPPRVHRRDHLAHRRPVPFRRAGLAGAAADRLGPGAGHRADGRRDPARRLHAGRRRDVRSHLAAQPDARLERHAGGGGGGRGDPGPDRQRRAVAAVRPGRASSASSTPSSIPPSTPSCPCWSATRLLPPANALVQVMQQLSGLIGPAVAGARGRRRQHRTGLRHRRRLVRRRHQLALLFVRGGRRAAPQPRRTGQREGMLANIGSGLAYAWRDPAVRAHHPADHRLQLRLHRADVGRASLPRQASASAAGLPTFGLMLVAFGAGCRWVARLLAGSLRHVPRLGLVTLLDRRRAGHRRSALIGDRPEPAGRGRGPRLLIGLGAGFINVRVIAWLQARTAGGVCAAGS